MRNIRPRSNGIEEAQDKPRKKFKNSTVKNYLYRTRRIFKYRYYRFTLHAHHTKSGVWVPKWASRDKTDSHCLKQSSHRKQFPSLQGNATETESDNNTSLWMCVPSFVDEEGTSCGVPWPFPLSLDWEEDPGQETWGLSFEHALRWFLNLREVEKHVMHTLQT